jgi:hypothetical protein
LKKIKANVPEDDFRRLTKEVFPRNMQMC